ncbi:MAG: helix-turn-helix transcriptional regulator [Treponema sp.]|nr:helix-turn-helix transcriptional regulator [Treponema sp.]
MKFYHFGMGVRDIFKENLRYWRNKAGLTQEQLSEKIGYGTGYISEIESRNMFPKPETIDAISKALNITPAQLFEEQGCPKNTITFDKEAFVKEISNGLFERLNENMIGYFEERL